MDFSEEETLTDDIFKKIAGYVYDHARINLTEQKRELVRARLGKIIRTRGFKGYRDYYKYMSEDNTGEALREVMNAVSTNLTSFFRESSHFDFMTRTMLPELVAGKKARGGSRIRGWSAGCSSGEEVYTISIVLNENLSDLERWDVKLLASDIDSEMVERGHRGIYERKRIEGIPAMLVDKYFSHDSGKKDARTYEVAARLKRLVTFRHLNLMGQWPFKGKFDFIFCRNVMIYFDKPTQEMLVNRFYEVLEPGGYLFIGHSEGLSGIKHKYNYIQPTVYRK